MIVGAIKPNGDDTEELSMKAPMSVSKSADLGKGVPNCASKANGNKRQGTRCFTQVRALLMEVKPYVLLDLFLMIWVLQELIYHEIEEAKP